MSLLSQKRKRSIPDLETLVPGDGAVDHPLEHTGHSGQEDTISKRPKKGPQVIQTSVNSLPSTSSYLPIVLGGSHWHGLQSLQNIVIFGDSYSKFDHDDTWADYFHQRTRARSTTSELQNFASPGATTEEDILDQLAAFFEKFPAKGRNNPTPTVVKDSSSYFIFLGINDCGTTDSDELESIVEGLFDALHQLYVQAGARNFVLFDVPPIDRSPQAIESDVEQEIATRVETWNGLLRSQMAEFGSSSKEATVLLFSPHQVLTEVLEDPLEYDFSEDDPTIDGGGIWVDDLHLTSEVHDILGEQLFKSLLSL
ncbi:hypothetical protein V8D89_006607 [Ganoderma adspersum]